MLGTPTEELRLHALKELKLLDTASSESFDRITRMASKLFDLPIAAVSLTDQDRQWFKSRVGVQHQEIPRERAPCALVAETCDTLIIPDLLEDPFYRDSPLARSGIRFYAGAPLVTRNGLGLGAMCVLGTAPRSVSRDERTILTDLAAMAMAQIELQHAFGRIEAVSGLPNRHQLVEDLKDQERDDRGGLRLLVIAETVEAARLQEVLRVLGTEALDGSVQISALCFRRALGADAIIYQVGPTQFAWTLAFGEEIERELAIAGLGTWLQSLLATTSLPISSKPVLGVVPFRLGEVEAEDLLRAAFCAAQEARNTDQTINVYSRTVDDGHRRQFHLVSDFAGALASDDQLSLVYQPRVCLKTGACVGAEALLRWTHPDLGVISPGEFVPLIEQTELVGPMTAWVIAAAMRQALFWRIRNVTITISVNVSVANLEKPGFAEDLIANFATAGLPLAALELEVTEGALIREGTRVGQCLRSLRNAGIKIAIDDFGTGYSSLSYLQNVPADVIKIDQSFIRTLTDNPRGLMLVRSMIAMVKGLGFRVVAEGVEDEGAYTLLTSADCDEAQGYFISKPVPPTKFAEWLSQRSSAFQGEINAIKSDA